ncbi:MAG: hypothetical protein V1732_06265 [Patescibacteria group bacterium]
MMLNTEKVKEDFFVSRGWQRKKCPLCLEDYYTKNDLPNCGSYRCSDGYKFLDIPAPKSYLEFDTCAMRLREFFIAKNYNLRLPIGVIRKDERTLFASTAGQIYDDLVYGKTIQSEPSMYIILQPVIRLQGIKIVGLIDGNSTSFVHAATEGWNIHMEDHLKTLDHWLDFFSNLGLHAGGLCLKTKRAENDWSGTKVISEMLKINYGGLEIGVANFFPDIPQPNGKNATLSDIGVGLERLIWGVNKSPLYFDGIGPLFYSIAIDRIILDALRTATLMVASGIIPEYKSHNSKLRLMIESIADLAYKINLYELVKYYHNQWNSLISLNRSQEQTYEIIRQRIDRSINLKINRALGTDESFNQEHEKFFRSLVRKKVVSVKRIHEIIKR